MSTAVFQALAQAARTDERVALGIITSAKGSSPQKTGALAVFHTDGRITGTLGGGCLEAEAGKLAALALREGQPQPFDIVLDGDFRWDDGMICGGRMAGWVIPDAQRAGVEFWENLAAAKSALPWGITRDFTFVAAEDARRNADELLHHTVVIPPVTLWIAGAGHVAQAVAPLAQAVGFSVHVFDDRAALLTRDFFPASIALHEVMWPGSPEPGKNALGSEKPTHPAFALIMTRGHEHDAEILRAWLPLRFAFLGMIGSTRKARLMREAFVREGAATAEQMDAVECPVGLAIGAVSPHEIAVSIVARLIERRAALMPE